MSKLLYFIRHGTAVHNVKFYEIGAKAYIGKENTDTCLTYTGESEATALGNTWKDIKDVDIVFTSSLRRTLQTSRNIFHKTNIPIVALDLIKEFPQGIETVNKRRNKKTIQMEFPRIDFRSIYTNEDRLWRPNREESIEEFNGRIKDFLYFLSERPEKTIAIVNHSSFIGQMLFNEIGDEENELRHCYPYKAILENGELKVISNQEKIEKKH